MRIQECGRPDGPVVVLIHGFGTSVHSWRAYIKAWEKRYRLVVPALGGMDPDCDSEFCGIEPEADAIAAYLERNHGGKAFALVGVSLGATIGMELLSRANLSFDNAILDAGPGKQAGRAYIGLAVVTRRWQIRALRKEGAARRSIRRSYMAPIAEDIIQTCARMSEQSCEAVQHSAFGYTVRPSIGQTSCRISYWYGSKEESLLRGTIRLLKHYCPRLVERRYKGLNHGQLWAERPDDFIREAESAWGLR